MDVFFIPFTNYIMFCIYIKTIVGKLYSIMNILRYLIYGKINIKISSYLIKNIVTDVIKENRY